MEQQRSQCRRDSPELLSQLSPKWQRMCRCSWAAFTTLCSPPLGVLPLQIPALPSGLERPLPAPLLSIFTQSAEVHCGKLPSFPPTLCLPPSLLSAQEPAPKV